MFITEQYHLYHLGYQLVAEDDFEVIYFNERRNELWLEKYENRISKVIRLVQHGFDWKNHLKSDIAHVFTRARALKKYFMSDRIHIYNVYVSSHEPVDDWEGLKRPLQLNEKKPLKMKVFYLSEANFLEEKTRLLQQIDSNVEKNVDITLPKELAVEQYKNYLIHSLKSRRQQYKDIFTFGKPRLLYGLIAINLLVFFFLEINGGSTNIDTLIQSGAKFNPAIMDGEWWRIVSSMFLHIGLLHLLMNMLALYYLGTAVESIYGSIRFIIIYMLAGIGGGLTSFAFNDAVAAGASGALFGLFGALLFFGTVYKRLFKQTMGKNLILILLMNLVFGILVPQIDMGAHLGGLLMGFVAAGITSVPNKQNFPKQLIYVMIYVVATVFLIWYGIVQNIHYF